MKRLVLKRVTYKNFSSLNCNLRTHSAPGKCPLTILKCPLSVLWRCLSYREFGYSEMTEKRPGPAPGVRLIEVSIKRELTVQVIYCFYVIWVSVAAVLYTWYRMRNLQRSWYKLAKMLAKISARSSKDNCDSHNFLRACRKLEFQVTAETCNSQI